MQSAFPSGLDKLVAEITASSWTTCYNLYLAHPALCCCFSLLLGAVSLTQTVLCLCCPFLPLGLVHGSRLDPSIHICTDTFLPVLLACTGTGMKWEWQEHPCLGDSQLSCLIWRWRDTGDRNELLFWCGACRKYGLAAALRVSYLFLGPRCCHLCTSKPLLCTMWVSVAPQVVWFWFTFCLNVIFSYSMVLWFWLR